MKSFLSTTCSLYLVLVAFVAVQWILVIPVLAQPSGFTLDFETGDLQGWSEIGTAFNHQPTLNDNPSARNRGQPSRHQGRYWIGTFERFQGKNQERPGTVQGDQPTGTLTSPNFKIPKGKMSFLIGGGNQYETRVELQIIGNIEQDLFYHATGNNSETMHRVEWDLSKHSGRTARIRIVDEASGPWGHINVDDFRFTSDSNTHPELLQRSPIANPRAMGFVVKKIQVPNLLGMSVKEVEKLLLRHQLELGRQTWEASRKPVDTVIVQSPDNGAWVDRGTVIDVVIAQREPEQIETPSLLGMYINEALVVLRKHNLRLGKQSYEPSEEREKTIIHQSPITGVLVDRGTAIEVVIAQGKPEQVRTPNLIGMDIREAAVVLRQHGLRLVEQANQLSAERENTVIRQSPGAGVLVDRDTAVEVVIDQQVTDRVQIPDLIGHTKDHAEQLLNEAGLQRGKLGTVITTKEPAGYVVLQNPAPGLAVKKGTQVDIEMAVAPSVPVPNLIGKLPHQAEQLLVEHDLLLGRIEKQSSPMKPETVIQQTPAPGTMVDRRSHVHITIAVTGVALTEPVMVPELIGKEFEHASQLLSENQLKLGEVKQLKSTRPDNTVIAQKPLAGTRHPVGSRVHITLATSQLITVPDLLGQTDERAITRLEKIGLIPSIHKKQASNTKPGTVIDQTPETGSRVVPSSIIELTVAKQANYLFLVSAAAAGVLMVVGAFYLGKRFALARNASSTASADIQLKVTPDAGSSWVARAARIDSDLTIRLRPVADKGVQWVVDMKQFIIKENSDHE